MIVMCVACASASGMMIYYSNAADEMLNVAEKRRRTLSTRNLELENLSSLEKKYSSAEYIVVAANKKWKLGLRPAAPGQVVRVDGPSYATRKDGSSKQLVYAYVE